MSALTDLFTSLANKIRSKLGTTSKYTPAQAISAIDDVYTKGVTDTKVGDATTSDVKNGVTFTSTNGVELTGTFAAQTKSVTPSTSAQTVTPDSGKYLSSVSISAISTQTKTTTPTTRSATAATVTPDSGKYLTSVTVNTNSVPNTNNGTYTYASGSTGGTVDMGASNTYRYVNAANVYQTGRKSVATNSMYLRINTSDGNGYVAVSPSYIGAAIGFIYKITSKSADFTSSDFFEVQDSSGNTMTRAVSDRQQVNREYSILPTGTLTDVWIVIFRITTHGDFSFEYRWAF